MYLKSIKASGFKSFADKTTIDLKEGITIVVGPNGSGKSNIVDAVRWVLGEQSVKALRGSSLMTDVIFSGSKTRSPQNYASVILTFDNTDRYLNIDYSEVEVKRICYQTGENEYYLNNNQVRLKDITDLFIDSGAGRDSFNIISQGKVSDIINQKPEDRRAHIEDAAGVLKYKKRKEEALRKLERTNDNLERINLIINELEVNLEPLRKQKEAAEKYLECKRELESVEIALIAEDIHNLNTEYDELKTSLEELNANILDNETLSNKNNSALEKLKTNLLKLEEKLSDKNKQILTITNELSSLDTKKQLTIERQKYKSDSSVLKTNMVNLKETELSLKSSLNTNKEELKNLNTDLDLLTKKEEELSLEIRKNTSTKNNLFNELNNLEKRLLTLKNSRDILEDNISNDAKIPYAVKSVINNPRLKGIHGILGKLLDVESTYTTAIEIALGFNANVIITDNEDSTTEAINYLKENSIGRATFFPLSVIKPKGIDTDTLNIINNFDGFIDIASNLVKYDSIYRNIVLNQLGNTIIVNNINSMNNLGRKINYRYRIITLDGELLHTGGSVTGGTSKSKNGMVSERSEFERIVNEINAVTNEIKISENNYKKIENELNLSNENYFKVRENIVAKNEQIKQKTIQIDNITNDVKNINDELLSNKSLINNEIDDYLNKILEDFSSLESKKDLLELDYNKLNNEKDTLTNEINTIESNNKKTISEYNTYQNSLREKEVKVSRIETKLDSLLGTLNEEYSLTYEKAYNDYKLETENEYARLKVNQLKLEIKSLGEVNTGSISEYERINKRYTFLTNQKDDLIGGINNLNDIITSLDETMIKKFSETFKLVNEEFGKVFKQLFKGGNGFLELTNPNDLLNTGVEINAEPPGKNLKLISLLSGGEKTLTAISLLFAVLNIRPVPFCILDEVEANLDDVNVDQFGQYVKNYQGKTQFIIITHKKRTMEYADSLYGITMQESGVSKLVSVKLDNIK